MREEKKRYGEVSIFKLSKISDFSWAELVLQFLVMLEKFWERGETLVFKWTSSTNFHQNFNILYTTNLKYSSERWCILLQLVSTDL